VVGPQQPLDREGDDLNSTFPQGVWRRFRPRFSFHAAPVPVNSTCTALPSRSSQLRQHWHGQALATFRDMRVGLWSFDKQSGRIHKVFTPRRNRPLSAAARQKAIAILSHRLRIPPVS
jgi:hypothetical protein